jgi:hypothetical protein
MATVPKHDVVRSVVGHVPDDGSDLTPPLEGNVRIPASPPSWIQRPNRQRASLDGSVVLSSTPPDWLMRSRRRVAGPVSPASACCRETSSSGRQPQRKIPLWLRHPILAGAILPGLFLVGAAVMAGFESTNPVEKEAHLAEQTAPVETSPVHPAPPKQADEPQSEALAREARPPAVTRQTSPTTNLASLSVAVDELTPLGQLAPETPRSSRKQSEPERTTPERKDSQPTTIASASLSREQDQGTPECSDGTCSTTPPVKLAKSSRSGASVSAADLKVAASIADEPADDSPERCTQGTCDASPAGASGRSLGTALAWADSPADAARTAAERNKLVYLIHVSGNFEIEGFT